MGKGSHSLCSGLVSHGMHVTMKVKAPPTGSIPREERTEGRVLPLGRLISRRFAEDFLLPHATLHLVGKRA